MTPSPITAPKDFPRPIPRLRVVEPVRVPEPEPTRLAAEISDEAKRAFGDLKAAFERLAPAFGTYTTPAILGLTKQKPCPARTLKPRWRRERWRRACD